ncbi:MAG TPA: DinB family protein [Cyclobacteriaceae bacterium]
MSTLTETSTLSQTDLFIKMALTNWQAQNTRVDKLLEALTDEQLYAEIAPKKNTGIYLFGHLVATNDALLPLFGLGDKIYPELQTLFQTTPDKSGLTFPSIAELKKYWKEVNEKLTLHFSQFSTSDWFAKHTAVSEEDFIKEPHRNRLNVLIGRSIHQGYHLGQLVLLKK